MESGDPICTGTGLRLYWEGARGSTLYWDMGQSLLGHNQEIQFLLGLGNDYTWNGARESSLYWDGAHSVLGSGQGVQKVPGQGSVYTWRWPGDSLCTGTGPTLYRQGSKTDPRKRRAPVLVVR